MISQDLGDWRKIWISFGGGRELEGMETTENGVVTREAGAYRGVLFRTCQDGTKASLRRAVMES